jgi:hypothetical protein
LSCSRYRQLISRYVDNEVTPRQRADLLAHVQVCPDCAAWLARTRHTDVLLKGIRETHPSDRVRKAILNEVRAHSSRPTTTQNSKLKTQNWRSGSFGPLRMASAGILLRFDLSPARIALGFAASFIALVGLAFYLNVLPPIWSYNKLGFEYQPDSTQAVADTTPIPINAVSAGQGGVGGPVAVPNLVRILPADQAQEVALDTPLRVRFDQPMDRSSVESALRIEPPAAGTFSWDADNEVRFTPAAPGLLHGITYTVTLTSTALSMAGTPIKEKIAWAFRTQAAHTVTALFPDGATIAPTRVLHLQFDTAMQRVDASTIVSLRSVGSGVVVPFSYSWDADGSGLIIQPASALPEGYYYLRVMPDARTAADESLGQPFEFKYHVQGLALQLRLPGDRVLLSAQGSVISVPYAVENPAQFSPDGFALDIYALPAERLSELGAQANSAGVLPAGYPDALHLLKQVQPASIERTGSIPLSDLPAGIYLLVAHIVPDGQPPDWKMLVVSDHNLALTGSDSPIWATDEVGRAWAGAEISLYSPEGALLEKGLTDNWGLWLPSSPGNGAGLAIARDLGGHVGAAFVDAGSRWGRQVESALPASLVTDLPSYRPGGTVNFRLQLRDTTGGVPTTPVVEQDLSVLLLMSEGANGESPEAVAALTLKPDSMGAVSGLFPLTPDARPGVYTISVRSRVAKHDFPVTVLPNLTDSLSVYVVPSSDTEAGTAITRTVSVLGPGGEPAQGALVTARLAILGDSWVSDPVTATTGYDGRATLVAPLPDWFARFNDPGLYLSVEVQQGALRGSGRSYLDMTAQRATMAGMTQLVSPGLNLAVVARPMPDGSFRVRLVLVDQVMPEGDVLVEAKSPSGEKVNYSLDMARLLDAILNVPQRFAGGTITVRAPGKATTRTISLMPAQDAEANLRVIVPFSVTAGSALPVRLGLTNLEGVGIDGTASVWLRRVSGDNAPEAQDWQPALSLTANGTLTTTIQAPNSPGLWYVMAQAATPAGNSSVSWSVVRVTPGPWVQLPPDSTITAGEPGTFSMTVHNPGSDPLSTGLRATTQGAVQMLDAGSQPVDVEAGGWARLQWRVASNKPGAGRVAFSFMPSSGAGGSWSLDVAAQANPSTNTTYTSGVLKGERNVGVAVPWGLSDDSIQLEIRASNALLPALAGISTDLQSSVPSTTDGVSMAAARLSAPASVASAYARLNSTAPENLALSGVERSLLLQQLYSAQRADGGWSYTLDGAGASSVRETAEVLLAFHRQSAYTGSSGVIVAPDQAVINRALDYLSNEVGRPVGPNPTSDTLDEHAFGFYVLSLYSRASAEPVRSMLAYAASNVGTHGLSRDGQAWLALALWQVGNGADAVALLDHLLLTELGSSQPASAPLLDALVVGLQSLPAGGARSSDLPDYAAAARLAVRALMEAREGVGWHTPAMTAEAVWALSGYAAAEGDAPQSSAGTPTLVLGDHQLQAAGLPGNPGTLSVMLSGAELRPGTNRLKLKASTADQTMYYSLTLIATR